MNRISGFESAYNAQKIVILFKKKRETRFHVVYNISINNKTQDERGFTMAIISQQTIFVWADIAELGDLERLKLVLENMEDEELMRVLESERGKGRDDYPVRAVWNSILAGVVFEHVSIESLRRELSRNGQLRNICGLYGWGDKAVPPHWVYTRFLKKIFKHEKEVERIFERLVAELRNLLPDFGKDLAIDSKAIHSLSKKENKCSKEDGRRDKDANWGRKEYRGIKEDGKAWQKVVQWFGYKLHLIVDSNYELPVAYSLTRASVSDISEAHKMIDELGEERAEILERCETLEGDRGYDDSKFIKKLWDDYKIKPVIDIRNVWKDTDATRQLGCYQNVVYNHRGNVYCYCLESGERREMAPGGFEESRQSLKKLCPARQYGIECKCMDICEARKGIRIKLDVDRRIFTPIDRASYKWDRYYDKRTAVERVNSRLDESFGFERHYIRGKRKMSIRCGIALCVMLAMAVGRIKEKRQDLMRSLVKTA